MVKRKTKKVNRKRRGGASFFNGFGSAFLSSAKNQGAAANEGAAAPANQGAAATSEGDEVVEPVVAKKVVPAPKSIGRATGKPAAAAPAAAASTGSSLTLNVGDFSTGGKLLQKLWSFAQQNNLS